MRLRRLTAHDGAEKVRLIGGGEGRVAAQQDVRDDADCTAGVRCEAGGGRNE